MIMGLPLRCRYWSILYVIIIVTCSRGTVSSAEKVQGCVESQLNLRCPEMKVIRIENIVLGDSGCYGTSCCIKVSDCTHAASANHRTDVLRRCDNKRNCTVKVVQESIPCWYLRSRANNDYERIVYNCIHVDDTRNDTMNNSTYEASTGKDNHPDFDAGFGEKIAHSCNGSQLNLRCEEMKVINVARVVLGDSYGIRSLCNISDYNCTGYSNANHATDVGRKCNAQHNCTVDVFHEGILCRALGSWSQNEFELITYNCLNDSRNYSTSTDGTVTVTNVSNNVSTEARPATDMLTIVIVITCPIILLVIILVIVFLYRRKQGVQMKTPLDPVAMTEVDNGQNVYDVCADETQGTSLHGDGYAQSLYSQIEESDSPKRSEKQIIYSEVELRGAIWKDGETTGKTKVAAVKSSTQLETGTVSKPSSPQDDGCQIVIENDLYGMADNCVKDTAVESPTRSLAGAVSKTPSPQDDEGLTLIENDIYCH